MLSLYDLIEDSILLRHLPPIRGALLHMRDSPIAAEWNWRGRTSRAGNAAYLCLTSMNLDCGLGFWLAGKCLYTDTPGWARILIPIFPKATQPPWLAHLVFRSRLFSYMFYYISSMLQKSSINSNQFLVTMALGVVLVSCLLCLGMINAHRGWSWGYALSWMPTTAKKRYTPTSKNSHGSVSPKERNSQSNANSLVESKELSSEEKKTGSPLPKIGYRDIFPPSGREALLKVAEKLPPARRQRIRAGQIGQAEFRKDVMSMHADYRECGPSSFTPTGISVEEIDALQDFPDYAELSGVPLPKPYEEFKIETALPRPYRPFRWVYHQTMCTSLLSQNFLCQKLLTETNSVNQARAGLVAGA